MSGKPVVLAISRDRAYLRALRLETPLFSLKRQGLIADYYITDPSLFDVPDDMMIDVVWLQRTNDYQLRNRLNELDVSYLYDIDDLLLGSAAYRSDALQNKDVILQSIEEAKVLTLSSQYLGSSLQKYACADLSSKTFICPNALEFPFAIKEPAVPAGLILTSSEKAPLLNSKEKVFEAIRTFVKKHDLSVYCFGPPDDSLIRDMPNCISFGSLNFWRYHLLLAALPPMIGIAPVESEADEVTLEFIAGKSDIKLLDYVGFGHSFLCSDAPPYSHSDLNVGVRCSNTTESWLSNLELVFSDLWRNTQIEQQSIIESRDISKIARVHWYEAVSAARLSKPLPGHVLKTRKGKAFFFLNAAKHMVFSQNHAFLKLVESQLPKPLLKLIRKYLLHT